MNSAYDPDCEHLLAVYFGIDGDWTDREHDELWWAHKYLLGERDGGKDWEVKLSVATRASGRIVTTVGRIIF